MCENNYQAKWSAAAQGHGKILVDRDGDKIGKLHDVFVDMEPGPPGQFVAALRSGAACDYVVHQATGMVAAQLEVSVGQALVRLRAYAFGNDRPLTDVARDVVARKLRFDAASGENDRGA